MAKWQSMWIFVTVCVPYYFFIDIGRVASACRILSIYVFVEGICYLFSSTLARWRLCCWSWQRYAIYWVPVVETVTGCYVAGACLNTVIDSRTWAVLQWARLWARDWYRSWRETQCWIQSRYVAYADVTREIKLFQPASTSVWNNIISKRGNLS